MYMWLSSSSPYGEIGQELLTNVNERVEAEESVEEVKVVKKVDKKKTIEITEAAVNKMKADGMTYAAIAKEFGISAPTLATRRQNWELERVRANRQASKDMDKPHGDHRVTVKPVDEVLDASTIPYTYETEIAELKEAISQKDVIIKEQQCTIEQLTAERDKLADRSETSSGWQEEIKDERKLLAILLERETLRIKNLLEVG
ncbi:hypothetical protein [Sporosarcina sp. Te-1]|uniref:hypothetical protein n=1 Tax=Sporosarcina sp. Te-1 TaxID=2818390 RepID=UPI001A9DBADC|nr:hypothetical protein [Sporosarcina sp. Te-1]QTD42519.1 hypothetical protein J3U78_06840 [Sporosarcina sp. Te-1]